MPRMKIAGSMAEKFGDEVVTHNEIKPAYTPRKAASEICMRLHEAVLIGNFATLRESPYVTEAYLSRFDDVGLRGLVGELEALAKKFREL